MFDEAFAKVLKNILKEKTSTTVCIFDKGVREEILLKIPSIYVF